MATILNIETSTSICSVALARNGEVINMREDVQGQAHATALTVFIEEVIKEAGLKPTDLQAVAVSKGPGSYTGLRIGVSAAKGLCFGLNIPLIAVETLQSLVAQIISRNKNKIPKNLDLQNILFCPMIDARRMEVYTALYTSELKRLSEISADIVNCIYLEEKLQENKIIFFGDGADKCAGIITHPNAIFIPEIQTSAQDLAEISNKSFENKEFVDTAYFEPFYLKDFVATTGKKLF